MAVYKPEKQMYIADHFSRAALQSEDMEESMFTVLTNELENITPGSTALRQDIWRQAKSSAKGHRTKTQPPESQKWLKNVFLTGWPENKDKESTCCCSRILELQ